MKFNIVWRVGLVLVMVGLLGTGLTGYFAYQASRAQLVQAAEQRLQTATQVLMRQVKVALGEVQADVQLLAGHPHLPRILQGKPGSFQSFSEDNLAKLFEGMLAVHPDYLQVRLVGADQHGLERIRIDRGKQGPLRITGDDLQEKAHTACIVETLALPPGGIYISSAVISREFLSLSPTNLPALKVAAPIHDARQRAIGLIAITIDLQGLFNQLAADLPPELHLYLANGNGDYLIHPEPSHRFAFDRGQTARIQDEFPATVALLQGGAEARPQLIVASSASALQPLLAAFTRRSIPGMASQDAFILGLSQPLRSVLAVSDTLARTILVIVIVFSVMTILLAVLLARAITQPLFHIVRNIRKFADDGNIGTLPVARRDEIGELAHSILNMERQITGQIEDLRKQRALLDHIASHDSLTGLPNRRMFLDRLEHALARAKRQDEKLLLLYIDLNGFKAINDTHGHAAGDAVLQAVAQRLRALLRESDTAARLGGDEFIVLLEGTWDAAQIGQMVDKVQRTLSQPIPYQDIALHVGGSIGASRFPQDGSTASVLIAVADEAMYQCKPHTR